MATAPGGDFGLFPLTAELVAKESQWSGEVLYRTVVADGLKLKGA
jgi:hypothetical protein